VFFSKKTRRAFFLLPVLLIAAASTSCVEAPVRAGVTSSNKCYSCNGTGILGGMGVKIDGTGYGKICPDCNGSGKR